MSVEGRLDAAEAVRLLAEDADTDHVPGPAFQWYPRQWLGDPLVMLMEPLAQWAHHRLICIAWEQDPPCSIPDDDLSIRGWCQHVPEWERIWAQVSRAWVLHKGRWWQAGLCRIYLHQMGVRKQRANAAAIRWHNKSNADASDSAANASVARAFAVSPQCSSSSSSSSSSTASSTATSKTTTTTPAPAGASARREGRGRKPKRSERPPIPGRLAEVEGFAEIWERRIQALPSGKRPTPAGEEDQLDEMLLILERDGPAGVVSATREAINRKWTGFRAEWIRNGPSRPSYENGQHQRPGPAASSTDLRRYAAQAGADPELFEKAERLERESIERSREQGRAWVAAQRGEGDAPS